MQSDYEAEQTTLSNTLESKKEEVADLDQQLQAAVAAAEAKRQAEEAANDQVQQETEVKFDRCIDKQQWFTDCR